MKTKREAPALEEVPSPERQYRLSPAQLLKLLQRQSKYTVELVSKSDSALRRFRVLYARHSVALQERAGGADIQIETGRGRDDRRSAGTRDWFDALEQAQRIIRERSLADHTGPQPDSTAPTNAVDPPISVVIDYYVRRRFGGGDDMVSAVHARRLDRVFAIIEHRYGPGKPVPFFGKDFVDEYMAARVNTVILFPEHFGRRPCRPVEVRTAIGELKDLSGAMTYAVKNDIIAANPLANYEWDERWLSGDENVVENMEEAHVKRYPLLMSRPALTDPATGERLAAPINRVAATDRGARARCFIAFLFKHAHRPTSVLNLDCEDIALTYEEMQALLDQAPNHRTWWADHWPYGAVFWRKSKKDYRRVTPFSRTMRLEIDRWKALHPEWCAGRPVFPSIMDPTKRVSETSLREWAHKAHAIVRADQEQLGTSQKEINRWLSGEVLYGYRSLWATLMDQLGYGWTVAEKGNHRLDLHKHVAFYGDWALPGNTMDTVYAKLHPGVLLAIAEFERAEDVYERFSREAQEDLTRALASIYDDA
jgi:integrase